MKISTLALFVIFAAINTTAAFAAEKFVLVFSGGPKTGSSDGNKTIAHGKCLVVSGAGSSTRSVNSYVPGQVTIDADLISCSFQSIQSGVGKMTVTLRRGSVNGEIIAESSVQLADDFASVAGR